MRQAIEENFILDVLKNYTTYAAYFKLLKTCEDDPNVERKKAARRWRVSCGLHPHNIAQKTEVMVEHFNSVTRHKIGGRAKAMVVTGSRLEAVRYKQSFDRLYQGEGLCHQIAGGIFRHRHGRQIPGQDLHRGGDERRHSAKRSCRKNSTRTNITFCSWRKNIRPASTSRCCTRCMWTSGLPAFRPCKRCRG